MPRIYVTDPRDPDGEAELPVHFKVRPDAREVELRFALDVAHVDVLPFMSADQLEAIEAEIVEKFDFAEGGNDAR